ncbi:hypothetical protein AVEN_85073-1 [Araneus ventricosus]|uniref:Uncharacterized protein n=1 Tax=Araneus ventricosus TaxID=182803 RepID=A0A4Y2NZ91_ARAVE|nr:hypothetical protein AVEN_85073-1 [Araneus ventricosus]
MGLSFISVVDLQLRSESGESLVSSCSQNSNRNSGARVDSTPSPDTSSVSSSLFVDVQEKVSYSVKDKFPRKLSYVRKTTIDILLLTPQPFTAQCAS